MKNSKLRKKTKKKSSNPIYSKTVRLKISSETLNWLNKYKLLKGSCNIPSRAVEFYADYCLHRKGFLVRILEVNYKLSKQILRKLGRSIKSLNFFIFNFLIFSVL